MLNNNIKYLETIIGGYQPGYENPPVETQEAPSYPTDDVFKQGRVDSLLWAFREVGYIYAELNPLGDDYQEHYTNLPLIRSGIFEKLTPGEFGLTDADLDGIFYGGPALDNQKKALSEIIDLYKRIYCSSSGFEFLHIHSKPVRKWFIENLERGRDNFAISAGEQEIILEDLIKTSEFENFLNRTYIGQRRFSIEGAEAVIPCLHSLINMATDLNVKEIVIGTSHRGGSLSLTIYCSFPRKISSTCSRKISSPTWSTGAGT